MAQWLDDNIARVAYRSGPLVQGTDGQGGAQVLRGNLHRVGRGVFVGLVVLVVCILILSSASAVVLVTYSSTADFDGGTKSDSTGDHWADNGADSPFYGFTNIPPAMSFGSRTYVTYQGGVNNAPYVTYFDHNADSWAIPVMAFPLNPLSQDGHGGPAILVQSTGRLHLFFGAHDSTLKYSRSRNLNDISAWESMADPTSFASYPHVWETANNTMYLLYRCGGLDGGDWCWRFSADSGTTWSAEANKIDLGAAATPYIGHGQFAGGKYVFSFVKHNDDGDFKRKNIYACRIDLATGNFESMSGTNLGLTLSDAEATASCRIEDTGVDETWYSALDLDASGNPYILYSMGIGTSVQQRFVYWTGSAWSSPVNIVSTDDLASYSSLIASSASNVEAWITTVGSSSVYNGDLERWTWDGTGWTFQAVLVRESDRKTPVNFPYVPISNQAELKVVFAEWGLDTTDNSLIPFAKIYGWGDDGFQANPHPIRYTETETDNPNLAPGEFAMESVSADRFGIADGDADTFKWDPIGTVGCFTTALPATVTRSIASGMLSVSDTSGTNACRAGIRLAVSLSGDWDIRIKHDRTIASGTGRVWEMQVLNDPRIAYCTDLATVDGLLYQIPAEGASPMINAFTCVNGAFAQVGADTAEPGDPQHYRMTRVGNVFTWFYSADGITWIQDEQTTNAGIANPVYFLMTVFAAPPSGTVTSVNYDEFRVASGTLGEGGHRKSASWTTISFSVSIGEWVSRIALVHSGLTADSIIDSVEIVKGGGVVESFMEDLTTGTTNAFFPLGRWDGSLQVRIILGGKGTASAMIDQVVVEVVKPDASLSRQYEVLIGFALFVTLIGLSIRITPVFGFFAGIVSFFLAFSVEALTVSTWLMVIFIGLGIIIMILSALVLARGD